jgi:hypothetical protein
MSLIAALAALALTAPAPAGPYLPDLSRWRLELLEAPGGWVTETRQKVRYRLVDPGDPNPPAEPQARTDPYEDAETWRRPEPEPEPTPEQELAGRRQAEAEAKANAWRHRRVRVLLNGVLADWDYLDVNTTGTLWLESRNGENRLEVLEPDSGARAAASWWAAAGQDRLEITPERGNTWSWRHPWSLDTGIGVPPGDLEVLEPDGSLARGAATTPSGGRSTWTGYLHPAPAPGTYTVRWQAGTWGDPAQLTVDVVLDRGTDRERHWRFTRLILPGSPPAILGTFDVDP